MADDLARQLTREVLETKAPYEVYLLDAYDPSERAEGRTARAPLGFGVESAALLLMPVVYRFFSIAIDELAKKSAGTVYEYLKGLATSNGNEQLRTTTESQVSARLLELGMTAEQVNQVVATVLDVLSAHSKELKKLSKGQQGA